MKEKNKIARITFGIISFSASIVLAISMIVILFQEINDEYSNDETILIAIGFLILGVIAGLYVKMTNFGIQDSSELQKTIEEKQKLKELIEIAELKKKLAETE